MAKPKPIDDNEDVTYLGQSVDPEIQKKVDDYMELEESSVPSPDNEVAPSLSVSGEIGTAPLLPTDKLPDAMTDTSKSKKITIIHDSSDAIEEQAAEETLVPEPKAEEIVDQPETEPENSEDQDEISESASPIDADVAAAPDFPEEPDYEGKTIADVDCLPLDDVETAQAIDEIIAADADELLGIEDAKREAAAPIAPIVKSKKKPRQNIFKTWFKTPLYRNLTIAFVLLGIAAAAVIPTSRYFILNSAGVRVSTSLRVLDDKTNLPLKNVEISIAGTSNKTDGDGNIKLDGIPLGAQQMVIKKPAFAEVTRRVTLGWGSNPLGEFRLAPIGSQYAFVLTDFLSGQPVRKGELVSGESSALFNEKGEAVLTVPADKDEIQIQINAENYRNEVVTVSTTKKEQQKVQLVPVKKHIFASKRSGKFDLYKVDVDGKNEQVILTGTGLEKEDSLGIAPHPKQEIAAFTSTRENIRNRDGFLLSTLQLVDLQTNEVTKVTQSERIQVIDWIGDRLVYVKIAQGASEANTNRHRLMSYDIETNSEKELASTNYFNDVLSANGAIYYSPALYKVNGTVGLYKINPDGSNKKTIFQKEVWNLFRINYDKVSVSAGQDWYELALGNDTLSKVGGAPNVLKSRIYVASPDNKQSIWIDERDGKTVLIAYSLDSKADKVLKSQSGIKNPIRWLDDDHIVYRVANGQETADYVLSLSGGETKKIKDVTNTAGIDRWYYF